MWLWNWIGGDGSEPQAPAGQMPAGGPELLAQRRRVPLRSLATQSILQAPLAQLQGRSVLLRTHEALSAAVALLELDGLARRVVLCPPDVRTEHLAGLAAAADVDAIVGEDGQLSIEGLDVEQQVEVAAASPLPLAGPRRFWHTTEWILLTSGTSGPPKLVQHSMDGLTQAFAGEPPAGARCLWSSFYDIRRYGGLQILLRALRCRGMLLFDPHQTLPAFLAQAGELGVTHMSGTASHWRAALMSGAAGSLSPQYVRLSGEIADQAILDALRAAYPRAQIAHAFASTEAGVAFEVVDGQAGFPAGWVDAPRPVQLRIHDERLCIRSEGTGIRYLGADAPALRDGEGFVDTGDRVERRGERYYFLGRSGGIINVGGLKVHPEEVEAVINAQPYVQLSRVRARRSPITGALVTAEVVLKPEDPASMGSTASARPADAEITAQIRAACQQALPAHKVPAVIQIVRSLPLSANGKLVRADA